MNKKFIILIQCRYDSSRLAGKILKELGNGITILQHIIDRLSTVGDNFKVATSNRLEDKPIHDFCLKNKIDFHIGSFENIAQRLYDASDGYEYIVRVTGDDAFVDLEMFRKTIDYAINNKADYVCQNDFIRGCDCDVFKRSELKRMLETYQGDVLEHIEHFVNSKASIKVPLELTTSKTNISLTIDTQKDLDLARIVFRNLYNFDKCFSAFDIALFMSKNEYLKEINHRPLITVYTLHKNYEKYLKQSVDSVLNQTFQDFEYVLVDYGSELDGLRASASFADNPKIKFCSKPELKNFIDAIKFATSKAQGKYIMRVDADDILAGDALELMVEYITRFNFYSGVMANCFIVDKDNNILLENCDSREIKTPSCALFDKKKYEKIRFAEKQEFRDGVSLFKAFEKFNFKIGFLNLPTFFYRVHDKSLTNGGKSREEILEQTKLAESIE